MGLELIVGIIIGVALGRLWSWVFTLPKTVKEFVVIERERFGDVWVSPKGETYHTSESCAGLRKAHSITKRSVCLYCAQRSELNGRDPP